MASRVFKVLCGDLSPEDSRRTRTAGALPSVAKCREDESRLKNGQLPDVERVDLRAHLTGVVDANRAVVDDVVLAWLVSPQAAVVELLIQRNNGAHAQPQAGVEEDAPMLIMAQLLAIAALV
eukprot:5024297-Prymnesium_polylepis.4